MKNIKLIIILMILLIPYVTWGGVTGKISGKIVDKKTGEPLTGATILLLNTTLGAAAQLDGSYYIINISPGTYKLQATFMGYKTVVQSNIVVNIDRTTKVDFALESADIQLGQVEVIAHAEGGIIRDLTTTSQQVNSDVIKQMPVESLNDIISLQAGITKDAGGGMHLRGGRSSEIAYIVDGMPVTNSFGGSMGVNIENNAVQQLEVISGTYNAEYGRAMSGIINIVTKEGKAKYEGNVTAYTGDFLTTNNDLFFNIDKINPTSQHYFESYFSGPIPFLNKTNFFVSGKYTKEENWLYGKRIHNPSDWCDFSSDDPNEWFIQKTGDSAIVPMNDNMGYTIQGKISSSFLDGFKFTYNYSADYGKNRGYSHSNKYNPDEGAYGISRGSNHLFSISHIIDLSTVQELRLSYYANKYKGSKYEDPYDPRYLDAINNFHNVLANVFSVGGVSTGFGYNQSIVRSIKYDITSQILKEHLVKFGVEWRKHDVQSEGFSVTRESPNGTEGPLKVDTIGSFGHSFYEKKPTEFSAYIQDKIEIADFVINAGIRYDYFDPNSYAPIDMTNPQNVRNAQGILKTFDQAYRKVDPKQQFSPRIGLAFPISDEGSIHASYGEFFQMPDLGALYENPFYNVVGNFQSYIGNADLEAQRTTIFEIGIQQKMTSQIVLNATCYYKDIRNLAGTKLYSTFDHDNYGQYVNYDYGSVYGITLSLDLLKTGIISSNVDYTYQVAEGNGSDPKQAFYDAQGKSESNKILVPLNWDQRHVFNWVVNLNGEDWGASMITQMHSGTPYTPDFVENLQSNRQLMNAGRDKPDYNVDLKVYKNIDIYGLGTTFFVKVENLLDRTKPENLPQLQTKYLEMHQTLERFNSLYEYSYNPAGQPRPRLVKVGLTLNF